jgi:glycosyltransferase involved in cell wall biosynthesis
VKVTGPVPDEDLPPLYAACEVLVYPSLHEGFGLQAAEGLACGAPLVVSDGGALPEIAGDSAVIFPAGDAKACAEAIRVVLARGKCDEVRLRGYAQASKFRWNEVVHRYLDLYRSLLSSR